MKNKEINKDYFGKIEYWTGMLLAAVEAGNMKNIQYVSKKLEYFVEMQRQLVAKQK